MKFRTSSLVLAVLTLIAFGCSKKPEAAPSKTVEAGVVELNSGTQNRVEMQDGIVCLITPKPMGGNTVMLEMQVEKSGLVVALPRVQATPDQPVTFSIGDENISMTPHLK